MHFFVHIINFSGSIFQKHHHLQFSNTHLWNPLKTSAPTTWRCSSTVASQKFTYRNCWNWFKLYPRALSSSKKLGDRASPRAYLITFITQMEGKDPPWSKPSFCCKSASTRLRIASRRLGIGDWGITPGIRVEVAQSLGRQHCAGCVNSLRNFITYTSWSAVRLPYKVSYQLGS